MMTPLNLKTATARNPLRFALVAGLLLALGACFETPNPECAFACAQDMSCPDGYRCTNDGWCKRDDVAESFLCSPASLIDGATFDSAFADAAQIDATPDAMLDATPDAEPDAAAPCPGKSIFEVDVVDWSTNAALADVTVTEGVTANSVITAADGRVLLCIEPTGPVTLHFTDASHLERTHTTTGEIAAELSAAGAVPVFRLLSVAQTDTLYASAAIARVGTDTTVLAMVSARPNGTDAAGADLTLAATNAGGFTPNAGDVNVLDAGATTLASGRVLFLNTSVGGGTTTVGVAGLTGCTQAAAMALTAGSISSVTILCGP